VKPGRFRGLQTGKFGGGTWTRTRDVLHVSCGVERIAGIAQCSSVFIEHPVRVGENASPGYHQVIPTITKEGHNFGHMRAQIKAHI
jgi:hypothetical protein